MFLTLPEIASWARIFFFAEVSTVPLSTLRILLGVVMLADFAGLWRERHTWLGNQGPLTHECWLRISESRLSIFRFMGSRTWIVNIVCVVHGMLAVAVVTGMGTVVTLPLLFISLISIHHRNPFILYGGDTVVRLLLFLLCLGLGSAGSSLSFDHWIKHHDLGMETTTPAWPLRLVQLQMGAALLGQAQETNRRWALDGVWPAAGRSGMALSAYRTR
jgi:hypothetical protein